MAIGQSWWFAPSSSSYFQ